jgi:hypothetical protein
MQMRTKDRPRALLRQFKSHADIICIQETFADGALMKDTLLNSLASGSIQMPAVITQPEPLSECSMSSHSKDRRMMIMWTTMDAWPDLLLSTLVGKTSSYYHYTPLVVTNQLKMKIMLSW